MRFYAYLHIICALNKNLIAYHYQANGTITNIALSDIPKEYYQSNTAIIIYQKYIDIIQRWLYYRNIQYWIGDEYVIRAFILYYLNIKPTHGYEIQKYIQINHMDSWTKIQSGSIYYALNKLEKEGLIELFREEHIGAKVRKLYRITPKGQEELKQCTKEELDQAIYDTGSGKFIIYPILNCIEKETIISLVNNHISALQAKKAEIEKWQKIKIGQHTLKLEALCFEMMISSLEYQVKWHEALLQELDECLMYSKQMSDFIRQVDFSTVESMDDIMQDPQAMIDKLRQEILVNPDTAAEKLEELIKLLKQQS